MGCWFDCRVRLVKTQRGTMAVLQLDDSTGQIEATACEVFDQSGIFW